MTIKVVSYRLVTSRVIFGSSRVIWSKFWVELSRVTRVTVQISMGRARGSSNWKPVKSFTYFKVESRVITCYKPGVLPSFCYLLKITTQVEAGEKRRRGIKMKEEWTKLSCQFDWRVVFKNVTHGCTLVCFPLHALCYLLKIAFYESPDARLNK